MKKLFLVAFVFLFSFITNAQQLLRGPYLQKLTSQSINIKWRTNAASDSKVYFGTDLNNLNLTATNPAQVTDHEVELENLQPFTKYYYKIESNNIVLSGPDTMHRFKTAPLAGSVQPVRVWAIGDFGKGNQGEKDTRDSYLQYAGNTHTDVWLWLGDNAYQDGTDLEYQQKVFDSTYAFGEVFKFMHFYPCPGNHDYNSVCRVPCNRHPDNHTGPYYDIVSVPTQAEAGGSASTREHYYSYDYGNVHFISLNSELGSPNVNYDWNGVYNPNAHQNSPMMQWLIQDLEQNDKPWVIAYWHQPPFSKGSHDSDDVWELYMKAMRKNIVPVLEQYGVDVILNGHSHVFERSYMINGYYADNSADFDPSLHMVDGSSGNETLGEAYIKYTDGDEPNKGTVYVIAGNSGSSTTDPPFAQTAHPVMYFNDGGSGIFGSFIMDINDNKLVGKYLTSDGQIKDQFTMIKQSTTGLKGKYNFFEEVKNVQVSPNPFSNNTVVEFELLRDAAISIDIFSLDGKTSKNIFSGKQTIGKHQVKLDATMLGLANGKYILKVTNGNSTSFEQVIKVN